MLCANLSKIYELAHQRPAPVPGRDTGFDPGFTPKKGNPSAVE